SALDYFAAMKFEMAATDASQNRQPQPGAAAYPRNSRRPAPIAARLEVTLWIASVFDVTVTVAQASRLRVHRASRSASASHRAARRRPNSQPRTAALHPSF